MRVWLKTPGSASFYHETRSATKVLAVGLGFLGDTVHLIPALWDLKENYAEAALHVVSSSIGAAVLAMTPCVERVWTVELDPAKRSLGPQWQVVRALRREGYGALFEFTGADRGLILARLTGVPWRVGQLGGRDHFWKRWMIPHWTPPADATVPVFEQRRQMLRGCGLAVSSPRFDVRIPEAARRWAEAAVPGAAVHLSINASTPLKEWPLTNWIELARLLLGQSPGRHLVATASAREREQQRLAAFAAAVNDPRLRVLPADLTIVQLAATLGRCAVHVGADSGVLHLAMALGIPTVSIFRDYAGRLAWLPRGPKDRHVHVPCPCVGQADPPCAGRGLARCLGEVAATAIAALVRECEAP